MNLRSHSIDKLNHTTGACENRLAGSRLRFSHFLPGSDESGLGPAVEAHGSKIPTAVILRDIIAEPA
jgi:hypothetical protein